MVAYRRINEGGIPPSFIFTHSPKSILKIIEMLPLLFGRGETMK
jgi:hypothetical protein